MLAAAPLRTCFLAAGLLAFCLPAPAAPGPAAKAVSEKYLPDDADAVLVVNVKDVAASPLYSRHYQKKLRELLQGEAVPKWLKDLGTALPRDVDRVTLVLGPGAFAGPDASTGSGPTIILEGRPVVLWDTVKQLAKDMPQVVREQKIGDATVYEINNPPGTPAGFAAMPDDKTLVLVLRKEHMAEVLDKAAGRKKTRLKSQALRDLLAALKPDLAIQFAATKDMVTGHSVTSTTVMGQQVTEVKNFTLADVGIDSVRGRFRPGEKLEGSVTLTARDEETAKRISQAATAGLDQFQASLKRTLENETEKQLLPVLKAIRETLKTVKIASRGRDITFEGQAGAEALEGLPLLFMAQRVPPPPNP